LKTCFDSLPLRGNYLGKVAKRVKANDMELGKGNSGSEGSSCRFIRLQSRTSRGRRTSGGNVKEVLSDPP